MNKKHRIFAIAASAMLAFGSVAPAVMPVFAEGEETTTETSNDNNKIIIQQKNSYGNDKVNYTYKAYKIFKARVEDDSTARGGKIASDIEWTDNNSIKQAVIDFLQKYNDESKPNDVTTNAKSAASYINSKFERNTNNESILSSNSFGVALAKALNTASISSNEIVTLTKETKSGILNQGYYLILSDTSEGWANNSGKNAATATSPIFAMIGGNLVTVTEKTSVPTVEKKVTDDKGGATPSNYADANIGQALTYTLTGTVASNIDSYDNYYYKFTDTLTNLELVSASTNSIGYDVTAKVKNGNTETNINLSNSNFNYDKTTHKLEITFTDLKNLKDNQNNSLVNGDSKIIVTYKAKLTTNASAGRVSAANKYSPNYNTVKLTYSNDPDNSQEGTQNPGTPSHGDTTEDKTYTYTYKVKLTKKGENHVNLKNAEFTIKATLPDEVDQISLNKFVNQDGSLGGTEEANAYKFKTGDDGTFEVNGLDRGTYTVHEVTAPSGYNTAADFTFTIAPKYDDQGQLVALNKNESNEDIAVVPSDKSSYVSGTIDNTTTSSDAGTINITVTDTKGISLPLTGQQGITFGIVVGGIVVAVSVVAVVRNRKKAEEE